MLWNTGGNVEVWDGDSSLGSMGVVHISIEVGGWVGVLTVEVIATDRVLECVCENVCECVHGCLCM